MAERSPEPLSESRAAASPGVNWPALEALFARLADLSQTEQRAAVAAVERDDPQLAEAVGRLLERDRAGAAWIGRALTAVAASVGDAGATPIGRRVGPYRLLREIGHGGMGVVFEATREDVFTKRVALKVATGAAYAPDLARRFHEERQILARLEHPSIARLLDGGTTDDGLPYLVMDFVDGLPITAHVQASRLPLHDRLGLFLQVCDAVQYAHESLVIHRDLKPANILVAAGQVRLLDFGIATLMSAADGRGGHTGTAVATLDYCSPEQLRGAAVTTRTDVYALGLVLYELLTGERGQRADTSSPLALEQSICETSLRKPSATALARGDAHAARRLRGDLDTIVATATAKDASRRYASAAALADDVRRHLAHRPIRARPATWWYRARRLVRRRWRETVAATVALGLVATGVLLVVRQARQTERRFQQVRQLANTLVTDVHGAIRYLPGSTAAQSLVVQTAVSYLDGLAAESASDTALQIEIADGYVRVAELAYSLTNPSLNRPDDASSYFGKADAVVEALERRAPDDVVVLGARVRLDTARAQFLHDRGRKAEGLTLIRRAIDTSERVVSRAPGDVAALADLGIAFAVLVGNYSESPAALALISRYLEIAEQNAARRPASVATLSDLGVAYAQAGTIAAEAGERARAAVYYRRAIAQYERALAFEPVNTTARRNLMLSWNHLTELALGPRGADSYTGAGSRFAPLPAADQATAEEAARKTIEHATWLYDRDPQNATVIMDFAIAAGRSAPALPIGDPESIRLLDRSLDALRTLSAEHAGRAAYFLTEFLGSRAERHRQRGDVARAVRDWQAVRREHLAQRVSDAGAHRSARQVIPMFQNWALTLAEQGDLAGARSLANEVVALADEVGASEAEYARAAGWPPRVRGWLAEFNTALGDTGAALRARSESVRRWAAVAARRDLPADLLAEARQATSGAPAGSPAGPNR